MSIDLILTLFTDADGNDKFRVDYPVNGDDIDSPALVDVTDQFDLTTIAKPDGTIGFCIFKKQPAPLGCLDGPAQT